LIYGLPKKKGENYWQQQITANCRKKVLVNPKSNRKLSQILNFARLGSSQLGIHGLQFLIDAVHGLHLRGFWEKKLWENHQSRKPGDDWLVGGFNPEKYESQLGLLFPVCGKKMFQTTNQEMIGDESHHVTVILW